jgi:hypothetical protein
LLVLPFVPEKRIGRNVFLREKKSEGMLSGNETKLFVPIFSCVALTLSLFKKSHYLLPDPDSARND